MQQVIDEKDFIEISNFAAKGIRKKSYLINRDGEIYSLISNKYMKHSMDADGYPVVNLKMEDGSSKVFYIHRLLMITFNFTYDYESLHVNHMNAIHNDNRLNYNLEWTTPEENNRHAQMMGLLCTGEDCSWAILTEKDVREICSIIESGNYISLSQIAMQYNCSVTTIGDIARGVTWKDISKDYNLNYNIRSRFTDQQVHFMCNVFSQNKEKSFQYLYYLIIYYLDLPEDRFIRRRIYKIYKKDPNNFSYITCQYNY